MYQADDGKRDPEALHGALYAGAIIRFSTLASMGAFAAYAREFAERFLAPHPPTQIHRHLDQQALTGLLAETQRAFSNDAAVKRLWRDVIEEVGIDAGQTARDRLVLRFQPPLPPGGERPWARGTATVGFHRDTWGTNLYAQVNWWAPIFPITAGRTFAFYPHLFDRPLRNTSAGFDLAQIIRRQREAPETLRAGESVPQLIEEIDAGLARPVVLDPGEIIAFSSQHAHAGVVNRTEETRISFQTRTLFIPDHLAGRGARNVDGRAKWIAFGLFRRMSDGKKLAEVLGVEAMERFHEELSSSNSDLW